jgi:putative ABC transport system permease protein
MGVSGQLATQNAGRNPHRTATTAAALMIGLALVSMALTVGQSVKAQLRSTLESSVKADYLISDSGAGTGFPGSLAEDLAASPATGTVTGFRYDDARVAGETGIEVVAGTDHRAAEALFDFDIVEGAASDPGVADPVLVSDQRADAGELAVGDVVRLEFASGAARDLTVIGIFADDVITGVDYVLDRSTWDEVGASTTDQWLALSLVGGVTTAEADQMFAPIAADYPQAAIDTSGAFVERIEGFVDSALTVINALVALAVVIALIGIANTLALSGLERTRELGLLRAVGMTRRQLRRMVRLEAGLVALFGAALGVATGVAFGWAAVVALPESVTSTLSIPAGRIAILVAVAAGAGILAAWGPARRAGRLDVLDAIAAP